MLEVLILDSPWLLVLSLRSYPIHPPSLAPLDVFDGEQLEQRDAIMEVDFHTRVTQYQSALRRVREVKGEVLSKEAIAKSNKVRDDSYDIRLGELAGKALWKCWLENNDGVTSPGRGNCHLPSNNNTCFIMHILCW